MADIFIGYAKEDKKKAKQLAQVIEAKGWSVWWDVYIPAGKTFDDVIAEALAQARCIVVLWSKASIKKHWVKTEAERGRKRNILVPVLLDDVEPPLAFELIQAAPLVGWEGEQSHPGLERLLQDIATKVDPLPIQWEKASDEQHTEGNQEPQRPGQSRRESGERETPDRLSSIRKFAGDHTGLLVAVVGVAVAVASALILRSYLTKEMPQKITGNDRAPMVLVPAGEFIMGSNDGGADEKPERRITLSAFYMDKYEVSKRLYATFIQSTRRAPPPEWSQLVGSGDRPAVNVTWHDVDAYCRWAGKRLPTEQEWEKAARGTDGRKYPWGNEKPSRRHALFGTRWYGYGTLATVKGYEEGESPYGLYHMAGNVWEWTSSDYDSSSKVIRGGVVAQRRGLPGFHVPLREVS